METLGSEVYTNAESEEAINYIYKVLAEINRKNVGRIITTLRHARCLSIGKLTQLAGTPISEWSTLLGDNFTPVKDPLSITYKLLIELACSLNEQRRESRKELLEYLETHHLEPKSMFNTYSDRDVMLKILLTIKPVEQTHFMCCCELVQFLVKQKIDRDLGKMVSVELKKIPRGSVKVNKYVIEIPNQDPIIIQDMASGEILIQYLNILTFSSKFLNT